MMFLILVLAVFSILTKAEIVIPTVELQNAAVANCKMPVIGLGTATYGSNGGRSNISHPEVWNDSIAFNVSLMWYSLNATRYDSADEYKGVNGIAQGLLHISQNWTKVARDYFWITSKTGLGPTLGYNDSITQWKSVIEMFNTTYVDLLLIHWPGDNSSKSYQSTDPFCNASNINYNAKLCRQSTWKAYEYIFTELHGAKAIGVSNFEKHHIDDILELKSLIPSVNQFEFHGYWHEYELVEYCQSLNILVNGYSPLGAPDVQYGNWYPLLTQHPVALSIANKYNKSAAQIWLKWQLQQNIIVNPRSANITHQAENINIFDFELNQEEMLRLGSLTPPVNCTPQYLPDCKVCPDPQVIA